MQNTQSPLKRDYDLFFETQGSRIFPLDLDIVNQYFLLPVGEKAEYKKSAKK
jgi:hypothetical protein